MIRSFIRIALRFLWHNKSFSILNFLCLMFGLTSAIIAALYILNILSYDKFHQNYDKLYQVEAMVTYFNGDRFPKEPQSASLSQVLNENVPEIDDVTRIVDRTYTFIQGDKSFTKDGIYADTSFLKMFSFSLVKGDNNISDISSILISEELAGDLFKTTDCLGETVILKDQQNEKAFKVTGVLKNVPSQSLLQFDYILPFSRFLADNPSSLETGSSACQVWITMKNNVDIANVNNKLKGLIKNQETTLNQELLLFPLKDRILYSYAGAKKVWKEMQKVVIVGSIGFAILLIACFNFINLAIGLNIRRYREVGIKKVAGAGKSTILIQFLGETFILVVVSLICSVVLARLLINGFNTMFDGDIDLSFADFRVILVFAFVAAFTGLFSGILPALYLASSDPIATLKARIITGQSYSFFRQSLIVFQFVIPIVLIICMLIIKAQDKYVRDYDLGFEKNKLIVLNSTRGLESHEESFKADLLSIPGVKAVSFTNCIPTRGTTVSNEVSWDGKDPSEKLHFWCVNTDYAYNEAVQIKMTTGRYFDKSFSSDSACYVINDIAAKIMKAKDPIGSFLTIDGKKGMIIGVFTDFHTVDLAGPYTPTIISLNARNRSKILIRYSESTFPELSKEIRKAYDHYESESPFQPILFSQLPDFSRLNTTSNLVGVAFFIALILACLGLSGLASFTAKKKTKEIGIRKAAGATTLSIMLMLLKNFTKWLVIAFLIALPLAFILGNIFLSRFYFRTAMPFWVFIAGPLIAFAVALLTVSWQSWKVANKNPVLALSYE